jgi:hypothetical protein
VTREKVQKVEEHKDNCRDEQTKILHQGSEGWDGSEVILVHGVVLIFPYLFFLQDEIDEVVDKRPTDIEL